MAISVRGYAVGSAANGGDPSADLTALTGGSGSAALEGDLVLAAVGIGDDDSVDQTMAMVTSGYTLVPGTDIFATSAGTDKDTNLAVFYKFMGVTPDTTAVGDGQGGSDAACGIMVLVLAGVDSTTPFNVASTVATGQDTAHPNPPSIDHNGANAIVIVGASGHAIGAGSTYTYPSGYAATTQGGADDSTDVDVGVSYRLSGFSDPEDPGVITLAGTDSTAYSWCAVTIALNEVAAAADNRAEIAWAELEVPSPNNRSEVAWAELEVATIPAPLAWYMADAGTGAAVNNDPVPTWSDQSGNGNDASQATSTYQPIYKTNVQNGLPVLDFTDHSYTIPGLLSALNGKGGASVFAVWKSRDFVSPVAAEVFYLSSNSGTSSRFTLEQRSQADGNQHNLVVRRLDGDAATHLNGPANLTGMPFIVSSAVVDLPGNTAKLYRGGAEVASATPSVGSTFSATNSARAAIGSFDPAGAPPTRTLDGQIGEIIFYDRALTTAERQRVETYLTEKWGTSPNNRAELSWAELEVPALSNRSEVSWAELEVPDLLTNNRGEVAWAELEVPEVSGRAEVSWTELEVPSPDNRAEVSWTELEVPTPDNRAEVSWAEVEVPALNNRAELSWAELEVPEVGGGSIVASLVHWMSRRKSRIQ